MAQAVSASVKLPYGAELTMRRVPYRSTGQRLAQSSISGLAIGGRPAYGTDGEAPRYQLSSASLRLGSIRYQLPVSWMYNPWFGPAPSPRLFRLNKTTRGYRLWAMFADGAGGYAAQWQLAGSKAKRLVLFTDETYFF